VKLAALRDFMTVAERGSLRGAARHLGVAQPALSRTIRELEKELGVVLFERDVRGVRLTPGGEAFLRRASSVHHNLLRAQEELDQLRGQARGHINVSLSSVSQMTLLSRALKPFRARYPGVVVDVLDAVFPQVENALMSGKIDCYIGPLAEDVPEELRVERLFDNQRVVVARKGHPLAHARSLAELADAEWITGSITHAEEEEVGPLFARHGLAPPRLALKTYSAIGIFTALVHADMLMLLALQWLQAPHWRDLLARIPVREALPASPPVCLVHRSGLALTPAAEHFCTLIREAAVQRETPIERFVTTA